MGKEAAVADNKKAYQINLKAKEGGNNGEEGGY